MRISKYAPFIISSMLIYVFFYILININFPEKFIMKKYIIESRIDDAYRYLDKTKELN